MSVAVTFLGGLGEIGRNCAAIEVDGKLALVDCGLMFPEEDMLGVDLVLPDFSWIVDRAEDLECVVLTHGHEDHIGALAYLLQQVNVRVYGTRLAVELAKPRIEEVGVTPDTRAIADREWIEHGPFRFTLVHVAHSVPEAAGVVFDTPEGLVVHSGDFKLDPTPIDGRPTDLATFAGFGRQGVRLLLADSTNAERPGFVPSEASLGEPLQRLIAASSGRVIVACFASHVHRVQQAVDAVAASGRRFAFIGRSMLRNSEIAGKLDLLEIPEGSLLPLDEVLALPREESAVISTGSQGEPFAALSLMAAGDHRQIKLEPSDTVVISATPIPGNETRVSRVINNLVRHGVTVHHGRNANVHVSGHAAQDELRTFYNIVRPKALVPVHGEIRHLYANAAVGREVGIEEVEVLEDGDTVRLDNGALTVERGAVPAPYVYLDGQGIGDVEDVLRDRRHLADDGVVIVTVGVDLAKGECIVGPDVDSHGVTDDPQEIHDDIKRRVIDAVNGMDKPLEIDSLRRKVRSVTGRAVRSQLARRPVVIPVVIEV